MEKITFDCTSESGAKSAGTLTLLSDKAPYELIATTDIYEYHCIYGKYKYGYYISIPDHYIGCPMSNYKDVSWNERSLKAAGMRPTDASVVAAAISHLKEAYQKTMTSGCYPTVQVPEDSRKEKSCEQDV
jgi:hypothetical protein